MNAGTLVWFRGKDLRIQDHAPLFEACQKGPLFCIFVVDPYFFNTQYIQENTPRMAFLIESLHELAQSIQQLGSTLIIQYGKSIDVIPQWVQNTHATKLVAHRWSESFGQKRDSIITSRINIPFELYDGETLHSPGQLRTLSGHPFQVFTPFAKAFRSQVSIPRPLPAPMTIPPCPPEYMKLSKPLPTLREYGVQEKMNLHPGGEIHGYQRLVDFIQNRAHEYHLVRDRVDLHRTSMLSADLKFGTLSARQVWHALLPLHDKAPQAYERYTNEILWREFSHSVLRENPSLLHKPHRQEFQFFPWENHPDWLDAWKTGHTGYPIVDAAARQLLTTGFVHNRARMIAASFLTKDLLCDYRLGEAHYMHYLIDGDWAQNNAGWQWCTGCGFDAQPYFRIFNPTQQSMKFDPHGDYIRRYVPELSSLSNEWIHEPSAAPPLILASAGVKLGTTYPFPIVNHKEARTRFLEKAKVIKERHVSQMDL